MSRQALLAIVVVAVLQSACGFISTPTPVTIVQTVEVEVTRQITQQVTREVVVTATAEPTATATPEPRLIFEEAFETSDSEWNTEDSPEASIHISDGRLIIEVHSSQRNMYANHPELELLDAYVLDVDLSYISGPTGAEAGIAFRCSQEGEEWLQVSIDADSLFAVARITPQETELESTDVIPWVRLAALRRGSTLNHIQLIDNSRQVTVSVNGKLVATWPYDTVAPGCPYLFVGTYEEGEAIWAFDNVTVREIEP